MSDVELIPQPRSDVEVHHDRSFPDSAQLLEAFGDSVYGVDRHGRCTFVNRKALRLLGYEAADDLLGRHMHDLIHHTRPDGSAYPAHDCPLLRTFVDGEPVLLDDELLWRRDGTSFFAEYSSHPVVVDGAIVGSVIRFEDLSTKRQGRQRLAVQQQVSQILGDDVEVSEAQNRVLAAIGSGFGWDAGAMWLTDAETITIGWDWTTPGLSSLDDGDADRGLADDRVEEPALHPQFGLALADHGLRLPRRGDVARDGE
ncbi:MAG: PAS domain-containing protein [Janthinobacterium lividum]